MNGKAIRRASRAPGMVPENAEKKVKKVNLFLFKSSPTH